MISLRSSSNTPRTAAFSLVEALVALVIVAALAVIGSSVISSSRQKVEKMRCASQLRQAGIAVLVSIAENNQILQTFAGGAPELEIWGRQLTRQQPLLQRDYLRCPTGSSTFPIQHVNWYWNTYGINVSDTRHGKLLVGKPGETLYRLPVLTVEQPAHFILLADSGGSTKDANGERNQTFRLHNSASYRSGVVARHGNHANLFFLDGHLESVPGTRLGEYAIPFYDPDDTFRPGTP